jgi:hypothetical protein
MHFAALLPLILLSMVLLPGQNANSAANKEARDWLLAAVQDVCPLGDAPALEIERRLPGAWLLHDEETGGGPVKRRRLAFALAGDGELRLSLTAQGGRLRLFTAEFHHLDGTDWRPELQVSASGDCIARAGRRIRRPDGISILLDQLDGDLETVRWTEKLQAPWPQGTDPGGIRIALVDSGLAYDLPHFRNRLARDPGGSPRGYDFWDMDPYPYDGDVSRGPFLPIRHGSAVASILTREAPEAALVPFRYPRPDMTRLGDAITRAASAGVRIIAMPLGSRRSEDWTAFERAMKAHPEILAIVSAGNNGRDIDGEPLWPARLDLPNMIVVTSADGFGKLAPGSNWGAASVDLMVPAENQPVLDFRGAVGTASGSSYAVPRLAALAARILAKDPGMSTDELKAALFARAVPSPYEREPKVAVGWIPDPQQDR